MEAISATMGNDNRSTSSVAYYEITDYSRTDDFGRPVKVKINPLNNENLQTLKEIATRNCTKNISNFNVSRYLYNPYDINSGDEVYVMIILKNGIKIKLIVK